MDLRYLLEYQKLKSLPRAGWVLKGVKNPESVAAHVWGVVVLVLELGGGGIIAPGLDLAKALKMALHHDTAEIIAGDFTPHDKISDEEKAARELAGISGLMEKSPNIGINIDLWKEMEECKTLEARFVKAMDKLDAVITNVFYIKTGKIEAQYTEWIPNAKKAFVKLGFPQLCGWVDKLCAENGIAA